MAKRHIKTFALAFLVLALLAGGCARVPTEKNSAKIIQKFFTKYGKKYPETAFGKGKVGQVDITSRQEIHKHLVAVDAFITTKDGNVQRVNTTLGKGPFGWKFISWENATNL